MFVNADVRSICAVQRAVHTCLSPEREEWDTWTGRPSSSISELW